MIYFRPICMTDPACPEGALTLAGGWCWFDRVEVLERGKAPERVDVRELAAQLAAPDRRAPGFRRIGSGPAADHGHPQRDAGQLFDGGLFLRPEAAVMQARRMAAGRDILDIGGESTRPGAQEVAEGEEIAARTAPVIAALRAGGQARLPSTRARRRWRRRPLRRGRACSTM